MNPRPIPPQVYLQTASDVVPMLEVRHHYVTPIQNPNLDPATPHGSAGLAMIAATLFPSGRSPTGVQARKLQSAPDVPAGIFFGADPTCGDASLTPAQYPPNCCKATSGWEKGMYVSVDLMNDMQHCGACRSSKTAFVGTYTSYALEYLAGGNDVGGVQSTTAYSWMGAFAECSGNVECAGFTYSPVSTSSTYSGYGADWFQGTYSGTAVPAFKTYAGVPPTTGLGNIPGESWWSYVKDTAPVTDCCNGVPTNVLWDPQNCGVCGNDLLDINTNYDVVVQEDLGILVLSPSIFCCNGVAVDLNTDPNNCGACGHVVPDGSLICEDGIVQWYTYASTEIFEAITGSSAASPCFSNWEGSTCANCNYAYGADASPGSGCFGLIANENY